MRREVANKGCGGVATPGCVILRPLFSPTGIATDNGVLRVRYDQVGIDLPKDTGARWGI